jgi:hypothetical protein
MKPKLALSLVVVAAVAGTAGCGGDETLSKQEVIKQASAVCKAAEAKVYALPQLTVEDPFAKNAPKGAPEQARQFLAGYGDALDQLRTDLGALELPDEDKDTFEGFVGDLGPTVATFRRAERAAAARDPEALAIANAAFGRFEEASRKTLAYGFPKDVCGA